MINRLRKQYQVFTLCIGICLAQFSAQEVLAQPDFFNFSYNGPTSVPVGPTCSAMLQGTVPDPVVSSTMGFLITSSMFDATASGFLYSDLFTAGTTAHVFWFVADNMGHSHTFEYFIDFVDVSPPTFDLTGILDTLQFSSIAAVPPAMNIPVTDNCTPIVNQTFVQTPGPALCQAGTFTRTWTATDAIGNTAVFTQTIIIHKDSLPPQITGYPIDGSGPCEALATAYPNWLATQMANFMATDPSGIQSLTNNGPAVFPPGCKMPLIVRFQAVDNCNFLQNVFVTFTTSDTQGPLVVKPPKDTVAYCSQSDQELVKLGEWINQKAFSQAFDTCSAPLTFSMKIGGNTVDSTQVVSAFLASFSGACSTQMVGNQNYAKVHGLISVDWFVQDACGNETFLGNADFGAIDTLSPVITGINATEACGGANDQTALQNWINAHGNALVTEDCSNFTWTNFSFTTSTGQTGSGNFNTGPYPTVQANNCTWATDVTFRATDDCGNSNTITLRWSIVDTEAPVFTGLAPNISVFCPNPLPTIPAAIVSDNCDSDVTITFSRIYKDSLCAGSYTVLTTWLATDDCGNTSTATQNIFVSDTTRPVFSLIPANQTFRCDTFVLPPVPVMGQNIMASDICSPVVSISTATNSFQNPDPAVCGHYSYNIVRTFTATDQCGNTQTATQTIFVIDNLGPVAGGILDTTALCSALTPFPAPPPLASDACSGMTAPPVFSSQDTLLGACNGQYTLVLHWTAQDVCGNSTDFDQLLHVIDTIRPTLTNIPENITVECDAIPPPPNPTIFNASDNCNNAVSINLVETELRNPDTTSCDHWTNYILQRKWTATDDCGNSRTYTQLIQIEDTTPPSITPPTALTLPNDPGICGVNLLIPPPFAVTDICSEQFKNADLTDVKPLIPSGPGSAFVVPVASMNFQLIAPNTIPFQPVVGNPVLRVTLDNADAEGPTEDFNILDEQGNLIGKAKTDAQCGDKTITFPLTTNQVNNWLVDGVANFTANPNGTGANACNPICSNGPMSMTLRLEYTYAGSPVGIDLTYTLDAGPSQIYPPAGPTFLSTGIHTIVYTATDCAGNSATASTQITINDTQPPLITPPANITAFTGVDNCQSTVTLPFPAITENCQMSNPISVSSNVISLVFEIDPNAGLVAADVSANLTGLIPNAVGTGILKISHLGDNAHPGEFFSVYDEGGNFLGNTGLGSPAGECNAVFNTEIAVTAAQINTWASIGGAQGTTFFYLESNRDVINFSNFIGNCAPLLPNNTDGISQVQVMLMYSAATVNYSVKNAANQVVNSGVLTGNTSNVTLTPGNYTVMYTAQDNAGLSGMATYAVTVRDTVRPQAVCQSTFIISVDPSGAQNFSLSPASINNGSSDNCTPAANLNFSLSPGIFSCSQAGSSVLATLTVTDTSGNSSTCQSVIGIVRTAPSPDYPPLCENGVLQLFANPPSAAPYSYLWNGPNGFSSNLQNPVVNSNAMAIHNGPYCVTITGANGCTASACVVVQLAILGTTPVLTANGFSFCPGQNVVLATNSYNGQNVSYQWLQDTPGGLVILGNTTTTTFTIPNPPPGTYTYYLKVFANGCNTALSNPLLVTMHPRPPADAIPELTNVCEGFPIALQSLTPPTGGLTYTWTGPSSYGSTQQNPLVTNSAIKSAHEGTYILVTQQNGCFSFPDTVLVTVKAKPPKPQLAGNVNLCAGQTIRLVCTNVTTASQWVWTSPSGQTFFTNMANSANELQVPNAIRTIHEGNWRVIVIVNGCFSDESDPIYVDIHDYPVITASSNGPICKDSLLRLTATFTSAEPLSWCWTGPNMFEKFEQNPIQPNGATGTYQVIAKTSFGCADTATVQVTNMAPPVISAIGNNAPPCCDGTTDAILSATITPAPASYLWIGPAAFGTSTLASPVIPDVCTTYNGAYTLVVKDSVGCPSLPATTEINIQTPPLTPILTVSQQPVCAGATITLTFTNSTNGATYVWDRPGGLSDTTTTVATLVISNAQPWHSGNYTVKAISANQLCQSGTSNTVTVLVHPIPAVPVISSNSPVCEGAELQLEAQSVAGATYFWTGPGFSSSDEDPTRSPVMGGFYKLRISVNGCFSALDSVQVQVVPMPDEPIVAQPSMNICMDQLPVSAFINLINPVNGMLYTWQLAGSGMILSGPSTASQLNLDSVLWLGPGTHSFRVIATNPTLAGCSSGFSNTVSITFDTIPDGIHAFAGLDRFACADAPIALTATPPSGMVSGKWSQIGGPTVSIFNSISPNTTFIGAASNDYTFVWSISNGACVNFSTDTVVVSAQNRELARADTVIQSCSTTGIQLHAIQGVTSQGIWKQLPQQAQLGIIIDNPTDPNTTISGNLFQGMTYAFFWEIGNIGCGKESKECVVYIYSSKPNAGATQFVCDNQNCTDLSASPLAGFETGKWSSNDPTLTFTNANSSNTTVCNLKTGNNILYWTINDGVCGDQSRDTVEVVFHLFPTANNDQVTVPFGSSATFNVLQNDILPLSYTLTVLTQPNPGFLVETLGNGSFVYRPQSGYTGNDSDMTYSVCNTNCPSSCSIATVTFQTSSAPDCFIPTIITPNGDGLNDEFKIPSQCTIGEGPAELEVTIFNQWGDAVFHAKPYLNDWGGTYNNEELPVGTYYFMVRLSDNDTPRTGFLLIQR